MVVGGGPAGSAAAIILARSGWRVLMAHRGGAQSRVGESLPAQAGSLLRELGVLDFLSRDGHRPSFGTLSAWGAPDLRAQDTIFQLHGHGWQLDRARFDRRLREIAETSGVELHESSSARILPGSGDSDSHALRLDGAEGSSWTLTARWIIDATGRSATLARRLGARRARDDALVAFHLRLPASPDVEDQEGATLVEAVENGWWYTALLPSGERMVVFLTDADLVDRSEWLDPERFRRALGETQWIKTRADRHPGVPTHPPQGTDARSSILEPPAGPRWIAVGDAACSFDPLSSKGISQALYTGQAGARALLAAEAGDPDAVVRYAGRLRQIFSVYLDQLRLHYGWERRWPASPFWARRQATRGSP